MNSWVSDYIESRKEFFDSMAYKTQIQSIISENQDNSYIYSMVQPTGLIYGCPLKMPLGEDISNQFFNEKKEFAYILLESFYHIYTIRFFKITNLLETNPNAFIIKLGDYYATIAPVLTKECQKKENSSTGTSDYISILFEQNIEIDDLFVENNFTRYFFNSLLFLDLIYFDKYLSSGEIELFNTYEETLSTLLKVFIAASHSGENKLSRGEKVLYENLIRACKLSESKEKETIRFIKENADFDKITFTGIDSYSLKKLCFEMAFLMIMTDNIITETEQMFLEKLTYKLDLIPTEKRKSIDAVQNFIYTAWDNRILYNENINYQNLHNGLLKKITSQITRNKTKLLNEIYESKELVELLTKSTQQELTKEEKAKVKAQLTDILKSVPSLAIFMLPGGALLLPILMKILPAQMLLPSSFLEKKKN